MWVCVCVCVCKGRQELLFLVHRQRRRRRAAEGTESQGGEQRYAVGEYGYAGQHGYAVQALVPAPVRAPVQALVQAPVRVQATHGTGHAWYASPAWYAVRRLLVLLLGGGQRVACEGARLRLHQPSPSSSQLLSEWPGSPLRARTITRPTVKRLLGLPPPPYGCPPSLPLPSLSLSSPIQSWPSQLTAKPHNR